MAKIIDGKAYAEGLRARIGKAVTKLKAEHGLTPGLAVVLVGEDPASKVYVANKAKQTVEVGMNSWEYKLPATTSEAEVLALVDKLNKDPAVHGILVQLPLPKQIESAKVLNTIDPAKDVDGFHVVNAGRLSTGQESLVPCTPVGSVMLAKDVLGKLDGLEAVVIGRSNIVGKPVAQLLLQENCTVTIAHSRTRDLPARRAARRSRHRRGRPAGNGEGRLAQARRLRHRCRHQPHRARRQGQACRRLRLRILRESRGLDHAGAGRRRADDHRVPAAQHGARGLCAEGQFRFLRCENRSRGNEHYMKFRFKTGTGRGS